MSDFNKIGIFWMGAGVGLIAGIGLQFSLMTAFVVGGIWIAVGVGLLNA